MTVVTTPKVLAVLMLLGSSGAAAVANRLSSKADYQKYIDPLLEVKDFGIEYTEDGAADATVLDSSRVTPESVIAVLRLKAQGLPLLIDCLNDGRLTSISFGGNATTREMKVPIGYVCLDILMGITKGPISYPNCADDGLGACVHYELYFRPGDYYNCQEHEHACLTRPWVGWSNETGGASTYRSASAFAIPSIEYSLSVRILILVQPSHLDRLQLAFS